MGPLTLRRAPGEGTPGVAGAHGHAPLPRALPLRLPEAQRRRLPVADGDELAMLDLDQFPLLDRVAGVLAIGHVDDGYPSGRTGGAGEILDGALRLANLLSIAA